MYKILKSTSLILISFFTFQAFGENSYPMSIEEEKIQNLGSLFDVYNNNNKSSVQFSPEVKRYKEYSKRRIKKEQLWRIVLNTIKIFPLLIADYNGGIIATDWISDEAQAQERYKISVLLKSRYDNINDSFEVNIFHERFKNGKWQNFRVMNKYIQNQLTDQIIREIKNNGRSS